MSTEEMYGRLEERLKALSDIQTKTLVQVTTTNGRVTRLEIWQGWIKGALAILFVLMGYALKHFNII